MEMNKRLWARRLSKQRCREWSDSLKQLFAELQEELVILDEAYLVLMLNRGTPGYTEANTYYQHCDARAEKVFLTFINAYALDLTTSIKQLEKEIG